MRVKPDEAVVVLRPALDVNANAGLSCHGTTGAIPVARGALKKKRRKR
jgi:hypothetical protein